jgi:hypothetical protein
MTRHVRRLIRLESIRIEPRFDRDRIDLITKQFTPAEREEIAGYIDRHPTASPIDGNVALLEHHFTPAECARIQAFRARLIESEGTPCVRM